LTQINYEKIASDDVKFAIQRQEAQGASESIRNILQGVAASNFEYWYSIACELNKRKMFYEGLDCLQIAEEFIDTADENSNDLYRDIIYTLDNSAYQTKDAYFTNQALEIADRLCTRHYSEIDLNFKLEMLIYLESDINKLLICIEELFDRGFGIKINIEPRSLGIKNVDGITKFSDLAECYLWLNKPDEAFRIWHKLLKLKKNGFDKDLCNFIYLLNWYADEKGYDDESFLSLGFERSK
jgi:hypothetical protein